MSIPGNGELRGSVSRFLEMEGLLGVQAVPLTVPTTATPQVRQTVPSPPAAGRQPTRPAPQPGPVSAAKPVSAAHVVSVPPDELVSRQAALRLLDNEQVKVCDKCTLCETRTKTVFGQGHAAPRIVFVGEAPGADEDAQGLAFVGRAGQLLTQMIGAMGLSRDEVFICNILKCRPPENRTPAPDEISACWPYLDAQLRILAPEVIVALGKPASQTLLRTTESISRLRGQWHDYYTSGSPLVGAPTPLMPTFHPAYLLRSPGEKAKAWSDLKMVMQRLDLPLPPATRG